MSTRPTRGRPVKVDEPLTVFGRPWRASSWSVPFLAWILIAGAALAIAKARELDALVVDGWTFALFGALTIGGGFAGLLIGAPARCHYLITAWCVSTPVTGGSWLVYTMVIGDLRAAPPWLVWAGLAVTSAVLYCAARHEQYNQEHDQLSGAAAVAAAEEERLAAIHQRREEAERSLTPEQRQKNQWEALFAKAGAPGLTFFSRNPSPAGFVLHMGLPEDGSVLYNTLRAMTDRIEAVVSAGLKSDFPHGASPGFMRIVRAKNGKKPIHGEVYVYVDVTDLLEKTIRMPAKPADRKPMSVYEAFPIGQFTDGTPILLTVAELHTLIVGRTRMGKSNLLHLISRQVGRCYDAVIWTYDGKGGRFVFSWLSALLKKMIDPFTGRPLDKCVFDWIAITLNEFERQLDAAIEASVERPLLPDSSGGGWIASKTHPLIFLLCDELSEAAGDNGANSEYVDNRYAVTTGSIQQKIARLLRLGAGEGVILCAAQQRGTVTSGISGDGKAQVAGRILLPVKAGEAGEVLADSDPETIRMCTALAIDASPGTVVIEGFGQQTDPLPGKVWLVGHKSEIDAVVEKEVLEITHIRPTLDAGTAAIIEKFGYSTRWTDPDRTAWMRREKPSKPIPRWCADKFGPIPGQPTPATAGGPASPDGIARNRAEALGLADVPDPFAPAAPLVDAAPAQRSPLATAPVDDPDAAARWAAAEAQLRAEFAEDTAPAPAPAPQAAATAVDEMPIRTVEPKFGNMWPILCELVAEYPNGVSAADVHDRLKARNQHPKSRGTVNEWLNRLADDRRLVKPTNYGPASGVLYFTRENWNRHSAGEAA